jgi:hypothetical protein
MQGGEDTLALQEKRLDTEQANRGDEIARLKGEEMKEKK